LKSSKSLATEKKNLEKTCSFKTVFFLENLSLDSTLAELKQKFGKHWLRTLDWSVVFLTIVLFPPTRKPPDPHLFTNTDSQI
jgi:hypothetical protein